MLRAMTKALDQAVEAAAVLPENEQDRLAAEIMEKVRAARRAQREAWLEEMSRDSPFQGKSEELMRAVREFREEFAFHHDFEDDKK